MNESYIDERTKVSYHNNCIEITHYKSKGTLISITFTASILFICSVLNIFSGLVGNSLLFLFIATLVACVAFFKKKYKINLSEMKVVKERFFYTHIISKKEVFQLQSLNFWIDAIQNQMDSDLGCFISLRNENKKKFHFDSFQTGNDFYVSPEKYIPNENQTIFHFDSFQAADDFYIFARKHIPSISIQRTEEYKKNKDS